LYIICGTMRIFSKLGSLASSPISSPPPESKAGEDSDSNSKKISRRRFARQAAAVAAAASIAPVVILAEPLHSTPPAAAARAPQNSKSSLTPEQELEVEARLANVVRKYGDRLTESQRGHIRRILTYNERMLAAVRSYPLSNGDAPASVLKLATGKDSGN
jgi:hypothetical protein